ncbi:MAG: hypothetical protein IID46_08160 [Planctomycetes bacterium]|nr:hypothetical protein [Planctomycetota bacterium]
MDHSDQPDLLWNAFRYVADEMSAGEQGDFERQLAADQSAREAVVRAVQLTQAVASLSADVPRSTIQTGDHTTPSRRTVGVWSVAAGLSVCLVLIVGFYFGGMFGNLSLSSNLTSRNDALNLEGAGVLVAIWSDSETALEEFVNLDFLIESGAESVDLEESEQLAMLAFDETLDEQFNVPDWMLAAVTSQLQSRRSSETQPEDN